MKNKTRHIVFLMLLMLAQWVSANTQLISNDKDWLGGRATFNTTEGNDFWLTFMTNNATENNNPSLNLSIYIVSEQAVTAKVEVNGQQIGLLSIENATGGVAKMDHIAPAMVYVASNETETSLDRGVHVYSEDKTAYFSCYMLAEAGSGNGTTRDASLILPTRALGREYYIQTYTSDTRSTEFAIVATENGTNVTITPTAQTSKKSPAGTDLTIRNMRKGAVYLVRSDEPTGGLKIDMSGSKICSDKPVAVFQGNEAAKIASGPTGAYSANHLFEQTLPVSHWGKEFYVGLTAHAKSNFYNVTAAEDGTTISINGGSAITLNAGESFTSAKALVSPSITSAKIVANKPVMLDTYLSCGSANQEEIWTPEGDYFVYTWGNSTMATVPSWAARVKHMSFLADTISNESADGVRLKYVQVITRTSDVSQQKLTLDGDVVPASSFTPFSSDFNMSVANIELTTEGKHTLETTGEGFVGFVYTITSEARAFQYTLGYTPNPYGDSLYINNTEALMSSKSYDLDSLKGHGWYQRQWNEWVEGKERLDTAIVCDSSTVYWTLETHPEKPVKEIKWSIYDVTNGLHTLLEQDGLTNPKTVQPATTDTKHKLEHQFILPVEEDTPDRKQFYEYELEIITTRDQVICGGVEQDTFRTVTRVTRIFNDTVWRAICVGDTLEFFYDSLYNQADTSLFRPGKKQATKFAAIKNDGDKVEGDWIWNVKPDPGKYTYTRIYESQFGCDSLVTLELFVCDTFRTVETMHLCSNQDSTYHETTFCGNDYEGDRSDKIVIEDEYSVQEVKFLTKFCGCQTDEINKSKYQDKDGNPFPGCDSIYELHIYMHKSYNTPVTDTLDYKEFSDSAYHWQIEEYDEVSGKYIPRDSLIRWNSKGMVWNDYLQAWYGEFTNTLRTKTCDECNGGNPKGCDSINSLILYIPPVFRDSATIKYCRLSYDWAKHDTVRQDFRWEGHEFGRGHDTIFTQGGIYYDSCLSRYNADSIYYLNLIYSHAEEPLYHLVDTTVCLDTLHKFTWIYKDAIHTIDTIPMDKAGIFYYVDDTAHCDSIYALKLTVLPTYWYTKDTMITEEEVYKWPVTGKTYAGPKATLPHDTVIKPGIYSDTVYLHTQPVNGRVCDSTHVLILRVGNVYRDTVDTFVCGQADYYEWVGKDQDGNDSTRMIICNSCANKLPGMGETKIYEDPHKTVLDFDSIYYLKLYRAPIHDSIDSIRVCQTDEPFKWIGHEGHKIYDVNHKVVTSIPIDQYGYYEYVDTIPTVHYGCDSIWHLHLYVDSVYHYEYEDKTCQYDANTWPYTQEQYTWPGQNPDSIFDSNGVHVDPIPTEHKGDFTYFAKYHTVYGCDSIWTLKLHIDTVYLTPQLATDTFMCDKDSFVFNGRQRRVVYGFKCPDIPEGVAPTDIVTIPEGATFKSVLIDGFIQSSLGCDSAVQYQLYVNRTYSDTLRTRICQPSEGLTWRDSVYNWIGHDTVWDVHNQRYIPADSIPRNVKGDTTYLYIDSLRTTICEMCPAEKGGCDSLFFLYLTIDSTYHFFDTIHICENGDTLWQNIHFVGDSVQTIDLLHDSVRKPGVYHERVQYEAAHACDTCACDSIYYLELIVHPVYYTPLTTSFCDNEEGHHFYEFSDTHGNVFKDTVAYAPHKPRPERDTSDVVYKPDTVILQHILESVDGCDSTVSMCITILPTYRFVAQNTSCFDRTVEWRGKIYSSTGVYYDSLKTASGCDSVFVLEYYIKPVIVFPSYDTICESEPFIHSDTLWYTNGESVIFNDTVWWPGRERPKPIADVVYRTADGCDSIIYRYYLTICDTFMYHAETDLMCSGDTFYSAELDHAWVAAAHTYDTDRYVLPFDTIYVDSLQTVMGCDSLYFLKAHVTPSYLHVEYDTLCENDSCHFRRFHFLPTSFGDTIVRDSLYTKEFGCDSIYELRLSVYPKFYDEAYDTICADETYLWHDSLYKDIPAGDKLLHDSLKTLSGCDSVYHMYLHVKDTTHEVRHDTICYGDTLTITETGHIYTAAGDYKDTTLNDEGCHHFIYTHLAEIPPTVPTIWTEDPMCQSETAFDLYYTYTSHYPIAYSLYFDSAGLAMGFEDMEDIAINEYTDPMVITVPIPYRDDDKTKYPRPDNYSVRLVLDNGICQHKETDCYDDSTFMMSYPKWLTEQRYGDVIALLNEKYNGGYVWSSYQWYQGDKKLVGQTNPYLYIPTGLEYGEQYHVRLTRKGETVAFPTCPITITLDPRYKDYGPTMGYLDVAPTCITAGHPYTTILSRHDGNYRITTSDGSTVSSGTFQADATEIQVPSVSGMYVVQLWSDQTPEEPYRAIKIVVRDICEPCATSF